ncbi:MAG: CoA transferase [Lachnospiraceae bacterium]|nr:CoA transferase [Lachnospiraceae bacterium]
MEEKIKVLKGIKVMDLTNNLAGPATGVLLSELGAEVIHIERPGIGDDSRSYMPRLPEDLSGTYTWANRGKKSVTLDLKDQRAIKFLYKMAETADILIESSKPGVLDKLGLGYDRMKEINPRLIYCSVSAFGHTGPNRDKAGYDIIAQAYSGIIAATGEPDMPYMIGLPIGDTCGTLVAYGSIMTALFARTITGKGQHIDVSLARSILWQENCFSNSYGDELHQRFGNHHFANVPYGIYKGNNGEIAIAAGNNKLWQKLCDCMKRPDMKDDPRYSTYRARVEHKPELIALIEDWLRTYDNVDEACALLDAAGVPAHKINIPGLMWKDKNALECGWVQPYPTPDSITSYDEVYGTVGISDFSGIEVDGYMKAPDLGQHNYEVMREYGLTDEEIEEMLSDWNHK